MSANGLVPEMGLSREPNGKPIDRMCADVDLAVRNGEERGSAGRTGREMWERRCMRSTYGGGTGWLEVLW